MWFAAALLLLQGTDYTAQGMKAMDSNQFQLAAELFTKVIQQDPRDYTAHFNLALAHSLQKQDAQAIPEYEATLALKPKLYQAELNLGILLLRAKQFDKAIPHFETALEQKPKEKQPRVNLAEAYLGAAQFEKAQEQFKAALESGPPSAALELGMGRAMAGMQRLPEAAEHFHRAVALDASYRDALLELASQYEKAKQPADAIAIYQQFPDNPGAQERLGELLIESKQFAEAIPKLERAVKDSPTEANRLALATAYRMNKEPQKELAQLAQAVAGEPRTYDLRMIYGRALRDAHQLPQAAQQFYAAAQLKPDSKEAWNELASVLIIHEDYAQGLAALDKVKALGQETAGNYYLRAITLDKLKQLKPALASYEQFLAADGGKNPEEEFKARQRVRIIKQELSKK